MLGVDPREDAGREPARERRLFAHVAPFAHVSGAFLPARLADRLAVPFVAPVGRHRAVFGYAVARRRVGHAGVRALPVVEAAGHHAGVARQFPPALVPAVRGECPAAF